VPAHVGERHQDAGRPPLTKAGDGREPVHL
jgi:hypothetical protein